MTTLRLILGDQLSPSLSSLSDCDKAADKLLMCEVWDEATYVKHHKKKRKLWKWKALVLVVKTRN